MGKETRSNMKPLHELIEASEPKNEKWWIRDLHGRTHICAEQPMQPYIEIMTVVDRASYDRMKQIAIELSLTLEQKACFCSNNWQTGPTTCIRCDAISKCRELLGEK